MISLSPLFAEETGGTSQAHEGQSIEDASLLRSHSCCCSGMACFLACASVSTLTNMDTCDLRNVPQLESSGYFVTLYSCAPASDPSTPQMTRKRTRAGWLGVEVIKCSALAELTQQRVSFPVLP